MSKKEETTEDTVLEMNIRKVSNGYLINVATEVESKEIICMKRVHVLKLLKEMFSE